MSRPRVMDAFPFAGTHTELLLLECRLTELYDAVDAFIIVEARVDHQDHPKPLRYLEHQDRFAAWKDKITYVIAEDLPTMQEDPGSWGREHAQREWITKGLHDLHAEPLDVILQSDLDEIPTAVAARNVRPAGMNFVSFAQRGHFWAIDWEYPPGWRGTVAARVGSVSSFRQMRDVRNRSSNVLRNAGWHFSWLGGMDAALTKVGAFCHPEVHDRIVAGADRFWSEGVHVDMVKMRPVDVDLSWPKWMQDETNVPTSWYRPR